MSVEKFYITTYYDCGKFFNQLLFDDNNWVEYLTETTFAIYCTNECVQLIKSKYGSYIKGISKCVDIYMWINYINVWIPEVNRVYIYFPIGYNVLIDNYLRSNSYGYLEYLSADYSLLVVYDCNNMACEHINMLESIFSCHINEVVIHFNQLMVKLAKWHASNWQLYYRCIFSILTKSHLFKRVGLSMVGMMKALFFNVPNKLITIDLFNIEQAIYRATLANEIGINISGSSDVACVRQVFKTIMLFMSNSNRFFTLLRILKRKVLMPNGKLRKPDLSRINSVILTQLNKYMYLSKCEPYSIIDLDSLDCIALFYCLSRSYKAKFDLFYKYYTRVCKLLLSSAVLNISKSTDCLVVRDSLLLLINNCVKNKLCFNNLFMFIYCIDELLDDYVVSKLCLDHFRSVNSFNTALSYWPNSFLFTYH